MILETSLQMVTRDSSLFHLWSVDFVGGSRGRLQRHSGCGQIRPERFRGFLFYDSEVENVRVVLQ